eukprot:1181315-Prorocentrum_minimum.AAC.2
MRSPGLDWVSWMRATNPRRKESIFLYSESIEEGREHAPPSDSQLDIGMRNSPCQSTISRKQRSHRC